MWRRLIFPLCLVAIVACTHDAPEDEELELTTSEITAGPQVQVVQFNPYYGGMYAKWAYTQPGGGHSGPKTYETAETFSKLLAATYPHAAVIGMEEIDTAGVAEEMRKRLGERWKTLWIGGEKQTGSAIYWRDDLITFEKDLGKHAVNHFSPAHDGYAVMFGGALLATKTTGTKFGFFTGKMTPRTYDGADDKEKDDEARRLTLWVDEVMAPYPRSSRIVAVDQNDPYDGLAMTEMKKSWSQPGDETATWKSPFSGKWFRYDYIWWDYDSGAKRKGGFVGAPAVMGDSGSDHRSVISTVTLAP